MQGMEKKVMVENSLDGFPSLNRSLKKKSGVLTA
jgi:hypothetical protein